MLNFLASLIRVTALIIILGIFKTSYAYDSEEFRITIRDNNEVTYYLGGADNDEWVINQFREIDNELPDVISKERFSSKLEYDKAKASIQEAYLNSFSSTDINSTLADIDNQIGLENLTYTWYRKKKRSRKVIWKTINKWDEEWEQKFSIWIARDLDYNFFLRHNIRTDCADAIFVLRWIFARNNNLPAANSIVTKNTLLTNETISRKWRNKSTHKIWHKDKRFMAALEYLMQVTNTRTFAKDSYPIKLTKETLIPGVFHLSKSPNAGYSLHLSIITRSDFDAYINSGTIPITMVYSTTPRIVRSLSEFGYWGIQAPLKENLYGFKKFLWPVKKSSRRFKLVSPENMPDYSLEQYEDKELMESPDYAMALFSKVAGKASNNLGATLQEATEALFHLLDYRVEIVEDGHKACGNNEKCTKESNLWDGWSTPSRDSKIALKIEKLQTMADMAYNINKNVYGAWKRSLDHYSLMITDQDGNDTELSLAQLITLSQLDFFTHDPRDPIYKRWGLDVESAAKVFIEKLSDALMLREDKVNDRYDPDIVKNDCSSTCSGPMWTKWHSNKEDASLALIYHQINLYKSLLKERSLNSFNSLLDTSSLTLSHNAKQISANTFWTMIPWLNSDPDVPLKNRWGEHKKGFEYINLPSFNFLEITDNEVAVLDGKHIVDLKSGITLESPPGAIQISMSKDSKTIAALYRDSDEFLVIAFNTNDLNVFSNGIKLGNDVDLKSLKWHTNNIFSVINKQEASDEFDLSFFRATNDSAGIQIDQITRIEDLNWNSEKLTQPFNSLNTASNAVIKYYDDEAVLFDLQDNGDVHEISLDLRYENKPYIHTKTKMYLIGNYSEEEETKTFFVNRENGEVFTPSFLDRGMYVVKSFDSLSALLVSSSSDGKTSLVAVDSNLELLYKDDLGYTVLNNYKRNDLYLISLQEDLQDKNQGAIYSFHKEKGLAKHLGPEGYTLEVTVGDQILCKSSEGINFFSDLEGNNLVEVPEYFNHFLFDSNAIMLGIYHYNGNTEYSSYYSAGVINESTGKLLPLITPQQVDSNEVTLDVPFDSPAMNSSNFRNSYVTNAYEWSKLTSGTLIRVTGNSYIWIKKKKE